MLLLLILSLLPLSALQFAGDAKFEAARERPKSGIEAADISWKRWRGSWLFPSHCPSPAAFPQPSPITSRRHFRGISSSIDGGVYPKSSRYFLGWFLFALWRTCQRLITTWCIEVG